MSDSSRDDAPTTPPAAIRPGRVDEPVSGLRVEDPNENLRDTQLTLEEPAAAANPDTLMSLPKPTPHGDLPFETRLRQLEDRLETLEARVLETERTREFGGAGRATPWWFWLLFLVGLVVTWRVLALVR
jgi:hypothetical protein